MVLRAVKVLVHAALLVQVLQVTGSVNGVQVNENFQNTELTANDQPGTVKAARIPTSVNQNAAEGEERGLWSWITGNDKSKDGSKASETPSSESGGSLATTTPIPGLNYVRPSYSSMMSKFGSLKDDFEEGAGKKSTPVGAASSTGAGSEEASGSDDASTPKPLTKKTKKPVATAASSSDIASKASSSFSGSEAPAPKPKKKTRKPVVTATSSSESASGDASASEAATPKTKRTTKKTKKPVVAAVDSESASEDASGSSDLDDLLGSDASGSSLDDLLGSDSSGTSLSDLLDDSSSGTSLDDLLGSSAGSGSDGLAGLLDSSGSDGLGGLGALGSMSGSLSFEAFMKEYGNLFGSGSSAIDLFGDPTVPQNKTIEDENIILGKLYGGLEHGDAFSDIKNIKFQQMLLNVTVRGDRRLDQVGLLVFTQEAVGNLVHGGTGGVEKFVEMEMGDAITSIEIHWDKNKGKTCIFYLAITTSAKKSVAVGTKTQNTIVLTPPKGYQFAGFHGRQSSSAIFCLGAIWTKTAAQDLAVTDIMAVPTGGSPDVYNYQTTIRNWTLIPVTDTEKLMDKAFQLQIVILDLPLAISSCFGLRIPPKLMFSATILAVVSAIVMMAVMVGEALFASTDNVMLMLRESGAMNTTALDGNTMELSTFLNSKNGTCGYEMKTLTNRVMGKVYEIRNNTPNAAANDVRVEVSKSSIITTDIPVVTNHCMGQIWTNKTGASSYGTRNLLRKTLGVIVDQIIEDGTTDMGKNVVKKEKALDVNEKTPAYNKLHQMRLAMIQTRAVSLATIDAQKKLRTKYSQDLRKAQDAIKKLEEMKIEAAANMRRVTKEQLCVDSDVFDSFSKQLVDAETIFPDLKARLEKATATIATEQSNIKIIREYVRDFAARKLQATTRAFFRFRRWRSVLGAFQEDVQLSAALEIQATWRMLVAKRKREFLVQLLRDKVKVNAANVIRRFSLKVIEAKRRKEMTSTKETEAVFAARKEKSLDALFEIYGRFVLHDALATWKAGTHEAKLRLLRKTLASAILIQRIYRGFRDRICLKRIKIRSSLTDRVGALVDEFIVSGNFWGFILEIDADYRRFMHKIEEEEADATTFLSTVLRQRKLEEDQMMQDWFTASALENPLISGIDQVTKAYSSEEGNSTGSSVSQAMLQSALVEDLVALSPNKRKNEVFPPDFPPKVIRQAMAKGFSLDDIVAVM
ncbi:hypothetical protein PF008_g12542 [Phytophthora fragariae]|uniref:Jacalin-type lectin domain-containing protein n=2 Tax=Phytophthora TaxID=4783 RepID=A0A6G0RP33_9STRA|nr:hypothetical protein PF008_g12542 [Phytophthora fragariae]